MLLFQVSRPESNGLVSSDTVLKASEDAEPLFANPETWKTRKFDPEGVIPLYKKNHSPILPDPDEVTPMVGKIVQHRRGC